MTMMETLRPAFSDRSRPLLSYGLPFPAAVRRHVQETFVASRVYVMISETLKRNTDALEQLQNVLGANTIIGVRVGMRPHTLWSEVLQVIAEAREGQADLLLTVGGSTLTDAAKVAALCLANNVTTSAELRTLCVGPDRRTDIRAPSIPVVSVPTTLSAAEYSNLAGATEDVTFQKYLLDPPLCGPELVILDPQLASTTPESIWLSTGMRAVDHCVETYCSLLNTTTETDALALKALVVLVPGLLKTKMDSNDTQTRLSCQLASVDAVASITRPKGKAVELGGSHGIGHQLGPLGVGHGETSCILLPAVCKYNAMHNANVDRQNRLRDFLIKQVSVTEVLNRRKISIESVDLATLLDSVIRELGMPRSLTDVGVGAESLDMLAKNSLKDWCCEANPVPLTKKSQVLEILQMVL